MTKDIYTCPDTKARQNYRNATNAKTKDRKMEHYVHRVDTNASNPKINHMNHLPMNFYTIPKTNTTMTRKHLKETLLSTNGWIMSCGYAWDIKSKYLGAGVYKVFLKEKRFED